MPTWIKRIINFFRWKHQAIPPPVSPLAEIPLPEPLPNGRMFEPNLNVHIVYPVYPDSPEPFPREKAMNPIADDKEVNPQMWGRKLFSLGEMRDLPPVGVLARCIYGEARGSHKEAKTGVAWAVRNRVYHWHKGKDEDWAKVILQPLQFSWTIEDAPWTPNVVDPDVNLAKVLDPLTFGPWRAWNECCEVARAVFDGTIPDPTNAADHYYDKSLDGRPPYWAAGMEKTVDIGRFHFFRSTRVKTA